MSNGMSIEGVELTYTTPKVMSRITPKQFGNYSAVTQEGGPNSLFVCVLAGIARTQITASNPDGEVFTGAGGSFMVIVVDDKGKETKRFRAGRLFFPTGFGDDVMGALADAKEAKKEIDLKFAYKVYSDKASNPAGRSWSMEALLEPAEDDPLSGMIPGKAPPVAIEDKSETKGGKKAA